LIPSGIVRFMVNCVEFEKQAISGGEWTAWRVQRGESVRFMGHLKLL
jgi:hypothetical protein